MAARAGGMGSRSMGMRAGSRLGGGGWGLGMGAGLWGLRSEVERERGGEMMGRWLREYVGKDEMRFPETGTYHLRRT